MPSNKSDQRPTRQKRTIKNSAKRGTISPPAARRAAKKLSKNGRK